MATDESRYSKPSSPLVWAILTTVLCCVPFGVVSIVYAAQVDSKWREGDRAGAVEYAEKANKWAVAAAACGVVTIVVALLLTSGQESSGPYE